MSSKEQKIEKMFKDLGKLLAEGDENTQKMVKAGYSSLSLEHEQEGELRLFCLFYNNADGTYRVTGADAVIVDNIATKVTFAEAINAIIKYAKSAGVKIFKKDIKV